MSVNKKIMLSVTPTRALSNKELDKSKDKHSARGPKTAINKEQTKITTTKCIDKVVYPTNICPFCHSTATWHSRIQALEIGHIIDNVWRMEAEPTIGGRVTKKFDFCLECQREFLIEVFCFENVIKGHKRCKICKR